MRQISLAVLCCGLAAAQVEKQVAYSGRLSMDIARPTGGGLHPAVIAIHGGGFTAGDRSSFSEMILRLAEHGYVAVAIDYRLAPSAQFPSALQDVKAAVRFLRANAAKYAIDPDRIGVIGDSAGATLALLLAFTPEVPEFESGGPNRDQSSRVSCVVSVNGMTDLAHLELEGTEVATLPQFLGGDVANVPREYQLASPISWITPAAPPVFAIHAPRDPFVPYEQSKLLVEALHRVGAQAELMSVDGAGYGFDGPSKAVVERRALEFLNRHLGLRSRETMVLVADHGGKHQVAAIEWPSGRELWAVPNAGGHDVQPLPDGHVLFTLGPEHKVVELDKNHQPVWTYGPAEGLQHPISAQRLANGNTLIGDAQLGKVIEVDPGGKIVWTYESADLANMRMRNSRRLPGGSTLISVEAAGKIIEVNPAGEIIWSYTGEGGAKRRPYKGVRLPNGNTLITMTSPGELVEVDRAGKIVRSIAGEKNDIRMIWASGFDLLPNGNILLNDYLGHRILEIGRDGKVVYEVRLPGRNIASIAIVPWSPSIVP
jgi:acetyl esterase/lipase